MSYELIHINGHKFFVRRARVCDELAIESKRRVWHAIFVLADGDEDYIGSFERKADALRACEAIAATETMAVLP